MQKTIFITGASSGLGKAAARLFQSKGWSVIATMRKPEKEEELSKLPNVTLLSLDITDKDQIGQAASQALALGNVDVVLNNAAIGLAGPLEGINDDLLTQQIDTNLLGAIRVTQSFIPHFRERHSGTFVNITSIAGLVTFPFDSLYHTVKFGLQAFSEGLSYELAPFGIAVKTVAPGFIRTNFGSSMIVTSAGPYRAFMDRHMAVVNSMMDPATSGSTAEDVAAVVYEAVTDGKEQLLYTAGADSKSMYERRLEIGSEASRREMAALFLGNQ
jgi:NAD(P)-dependent dehydrogenase (short-subunit alcohol dehydrogenase family)